MWTIEDAHINMDPHGAQKLFQCSSGPPRLHYLFSTSENLGKETQTGTSRDETDRTGRKREKKL